VESVRVKVRRSRKVAAMPDARVWGMGSSRTAKKHLEARWRDKGGSIALSPSLATSDSEAFLFFLPLLFLSKPAT